MARRLIALVLLVALVLPVAAGGAPYKAPHEKVLWGGQGGYTARHIAAFAQQSGKHPAVFNYQSASLKPEFALANHPASRAALRQAVKWPRLTGVSP